MHKSRVDPRRVVTHRLDPDYYHPQHLKDEDCLVEYGSEPLAKAGKFFVGPFGSKLPSSLYLDDGIPLFRISNIGSMQVDMEGMAYLDPQVHAGLSTSEVVPGDLLIVKASVGEKICKVPENISRANITQHIIALRPNKLIDIDYIAVFLFCEYGKRQLIRRSLGSIIQYLGVSDTKTVLLPKIDPKVQIYIGDKVRQAERLRDRSRHLEKEINTFFIVKGWDGDLPGNSKSFKALASAINPGRLDAAFYDPAYLRLEDCLKASKSIAISTLAKQVKKGWNKDMDEFLYFEIGSIDLGSGTIKPSRQRVVDAPSRAQLSIKAWDILVSTVRPNRKNVALVLESDENLELVASNGFSVLRFPSKEEAVFYHSWLRLDAATLQMMRWNAGGSYPAIDDSIAISTLVPDFPDEVVKNQGQKWLIKFIGKDFSERLTMAAKLLVEALIEGKISEGDLKAAQKGLEKSEITLDREILARLTRKGIDFPNEPPLFPDLDALYAALASLDATETTETANPDQNRVSNVYHLHSTPLALASEAHETAYQVTAEVPE
jgi:type I restriction enzyme, S subunit